MNEKFNRNAANCKDALALITAAGKTAPEDIKTQLLCEEKADAACDADQAALLRTYIGADPLPAALPADLKDTCLAFVNKIQGALQ